MTAGHNRSGEPKGSPLRLGRLVAASLLALLAASTLLPEGALAHGISGKADLPIPAWMFAWAAVIVLIVSFTALSALWTKPRLQEPVLHRWFGLPRWLIVPTGLIGVVLFLAVVYSGFAGAQVPTANLAPTFIYVHLLGRHPGGRACCSATSFAPSAHGAPSAAPASGRSGARDRRATPAPLAYPELARPLAGGAHGASASPGSSSSTSAATTRARSPGSRSRYFAVQLAGIAASRRRPWRERGDGFGVYFGLLLAPSPWIFGATACCISGAARSPACPGLDDRARHDRTSSAR